MTEQSTETPRPGTEVADPAPFGLAAFALALFLLSAKNAGWTRGTDLWLGFVLASGGLCQLLAGMWEFRRRSVFWATAFSTYGGFWIGLALYGQIVALKATVPSQMAVLSRVSNDLGWIMLAFLIFNTYLLLGSLQVNHAVLGVFLALEITEILLLIGNFATSSALIKAGGYVGVLTALVAWYVSAAGVINGMAGWEMLKVGRPLSMSGRTPGLSQS